MSRAALPIVFRCGLPGNSRGWEGRVEVIRQGNNMAELIIAGRGSPVSYTHLTLPTILRV